MHRRLAAWLVLVLAAAGCSGGGSPRSGAASPCPLLEKLDATADLVAHAEVADPEAFAKTVDTASQTYVDTAQQLRALVPSDVQADLDRVIAAVHQKRYADATAARAAMQSWAAGACPRTATTTTALATTSTT